MQTNPNEEIGSGSIKAQMLSSNENFKFFDELMVQSSSIESNSFSDYEKPYAERECMSDGDLKNFAFKHKDFMSVELKDFNFIRVLGVGAYGAVWLVRKKNTGDEFAMKIIDCNKKVLNKDIHFLICIYSNFFFFSSLRIQMDERTVKNLKTENNVFEKVSSDFIVKAVYSFMQSGYLFFVLDYMSGGDF